MVAQVLQIPVQNIILIHVVALAEQQAEPVG